MGIITALAEETQRRIEHEPTRLGQILAQMSEKDRAATIKALRVRRGEKGYIPNEIVARILTKEGHRISPSAVWHERKNYQYGDTD
jgi:hypothetical protein